MKANGYEWTMNGNEVLCNGLAVCELEYVPDGSVGYWCITGDDEYRFSSQDAAFYFVMERCK